MLQYREPFQSSKVLMSTSSSLFWHMTFPIPTATGRTARDMARPLGGGVLGAVRASAWFSLLAVQVVATVDVPLLVLAGAGVDARGQAKAMCVVQDDSAIHNTSQTRVHKYCPRVTLLRPIISQISPL